MDSPGPEQKFFVVASTDVAHAEIMMTRIRGQMGQLPELKDSGAFEVSAAEVPLPILAAGGSLQQQVQEVADRVVEMVQAALSVR
jgi:hypothetical protein